MAPVPTAEDRLLKTGEVLERLGIGRDKLYELLASGALKGVKIGAARRFRSSDVDEYIAGLG
jgi:excisionase family DNA binding protein